MNLELLLYNVKARLKAQVARSYLGCLWWIFEPLGFIGAFYFVFEFLLKRGGPEYTYQLIIGVVAWTWFGSTVAAAANSISRASQLMLQVRVNKLFFPFSEILELAFKQIFVFALLLLFLLVTKGVQPSWLYLPLLLLEQLILITSISLLFASVVPFLPDAVYLVNLCMRLWMFCSGVFYTVASIAPEYRFYFLLNPMANLIEQYRTVLIYDQAPHWQSFTIITVVSLGIAMLGIVVIRHNDEAYPRLSLQ